MDWKSEVIAGQREDFRVGHYGKRWTSRMRAITLLSRSFYFFSAAALYPEFVVMLGKGSSSL